MKLASKKCIPCSGRIPPMEKKEVDKYLNDLGNGWKVNAEGHLNKVYKFQNFIESMEFANKIAEISEKEDHHPDLHISWGSCKIEIWTHKINGLAKSDFYLAAKIEAISKV